MPLIRPRARRIIQPAIYGAVAGGGGGGVVFDAVSNVTTPVSGGGTMTWTHTPSSTPSAVAVLIAGFVSTAFPTSVTYGGVTMTQVGTSFPAFGSVGGAVIFGLANPPSGAQTVLTSAASGSFMQGVAISVTGSSLTTCFRNMSGATGTTSSSSATVSSAVGDLVIDCVGTFGGSAAPGSPGAGQTSRNTAFWNGNVGASFSTAPGASSVTDTWTALNGASSWGAAIASFQHA